MLNLLMSAFFKKHSDFAVAGFLLLATSVLWLSTISTPYWWDSAGYIMIRANNIYQNGLLNWDLGKGELGLAHPVFFIVGLSAAWKIFGQSLLVSHLYYLIFALIAVFYTYKLGKLLSSDPKRGLMIGLFSSVLLLITPLFMSQLGIIYFEMPLTAFGFGLLLFAKKISQIRNLRIFDAFIQRGFGFCNRCPFSIHARKSDSKFKK
jgi:hypothetical protein